VPEDTAALGERLGELRRLEDAQQPAQVMRFARREPHGAPHPSRGDD
jgi:hypothetical protein